MKLWVDDVRPAPDGYWWCKSVNEAKEKIRNREFDMLPTITIIDIDHDAGDYVNDGGDYIKLLDWLEWLYGGKGTYTEFHIHSMNPVGAANMRRIIEQNGWKEIG